MITQADKDKRRAYIQKTYTEMIDRDQAWQLATMKEDWQRKVDQQPSVMTQAEMDQKVSDLVKLQAERKAKLVAKYMSHYGGVIG